MINVSLGLARACHAQVRVRAGWRPYGPCATLAQLVGKINKPLPPPAVMPRCWDECFLLIQARVPLAAPHWAGTSLPMVAVTHW